MDETFIIIVNKCHIINSHIKRDLYILTKEYYNLPKFEYLCSVIITYKNEDRYIG